MTYGNAEVINLFFMPPSIARGRIISNPPPVGFIDRFMAFCYNRAMESRKAFTISAHLVAAVIAAIAVIAVLWLGLTSIEEEKPDKASGFGDCLKLLGKPFILLCFFGIICHVGVDVGTNTTAPKILMERLGFTLEEASFSTSLYFIFRTIGCLTGALILQKLSPKIFFFISIAMMTASMVMLLFCQGQAAIYTAIALVGYGNSNVFSIIFSQALLNMPEKKNEISGLMIMGLFGGTVFPLLMGFASDAVGQAGAVAVMLAGTLYLLFYGFRIKTARG